MHTPTFTFLFALLCFSACNTQSPQHAENQQHSALAKTQPAGTIIAADSVPYDKLNNFYFTVALKTTEASNKGTYDVEAAIGPSIAAAKFTMPRGAEDVVPVMKRVNDSGSFIIGFYYNNDGIFYDYYQVDAVAGNIEMKYTKAYRFK